MHPLYFLLPLLVLIPSVYADTTNLGFADKSSGYYKVFQLNAIQDGSDVTSVTVSITSSNSGLCYLELSDSIINPAQISDTFTCNGTHTVSLNQIGSDAFQANLSKDYTAVTVKSDIYYTNFIVNNISIAYNVPTYFAEIKNGLVSNVIVADQNFVNTRPGLFVQTFGNAGIGYTYANGIFTAPYPGLPYVLVNNQWIDPTPKVIISTLGNGTK